MACIGCPPETIDAGILSILNSKLPGCEANHDYAEYVSVTGVNKSVPLGTPCPDNYLPIPDSNRLAFNNTYKMCGLISANPPPPQNNLVSRMQACMNASAPGPAPTSNLVCEYCKCPEGSGRIDPGCGPNNMMCAGCPQEIDWFPIILVILIVLVLIGLGIYLTSAPPKAAIKNITK
jgi:hypothetical protein